MQLKCFGMVLFCLGGSVFLGLPAVAVMDPSPSPSLLSSEVAEMKPLTQVESSRLLEEFRRTHVLGVRALRHQQVSELKDLKASQKARLKEWQAKEKVARREFFKSAQNGAEKRAWMQDHHKRREALFALHKSEYQQRVSEQKVRLQSVQTENADRVREFKSYLERKERPPASLWPAFGH